MPADAETSRHPHGGAVTVTFGKSGKCLIGTFKCCKHVTGALKPTNVSWESKSIFFS